MLIIRSSTNAIIIMDDTLKQKIIENRKRLRSQTIQCFADVSGFSIESEKSEQETQITFSRKDTKLLLAVNRKRSQDMSAFVNTHKTKEILISQNFVDLFEVEERKLGQGAQSVVKKCKQKSTGKNYAVKIFRKSDEQLRTNLKMQYKILKSLTHANIIDAHYLFVNQKQNSCQLILELCHYKSLRVYLEEEYILTEEETAFIIRTLLLTISYMNDKGICHRDIKPQNILYDPKTTSLKLIDFQISKLYKTKAGSIKMWTNTGTSYYKAPQTFGDQYSQNIDVWSIGVLTYQMLTGKVPFSFPSLKDTITSIKNNQIEYCESLSSFAKDFIKRCLVKDPALRPTAFEILSSPFLLTGKVYIPSPKSSPNINRSFEDGQWKNKGFMCLNAFQEVQQEEDNLFGKDIGIRRFVDFIDES